MNTTVKKYFEEKSIATADIVFCSLLILVLIAFVCKLLYIIFAFTLAGIILTVWIIWRSYRIGDKEIDKVADRRPEEWKDLNRLFHGKEQCFYLVGKDVKTKQGFDGKLRTTKYCGLQYSCGEKDVTFESFTHDLLTGEITEVHATVPYTTPVKLEEESIMTPCGPRPRATLCIMGDKEFKIPVDTRDSTTDTLIEHFHA